MSAPLCASCDAEWLPGIGHVAHDDDCPALAEIRRQRGGCTATATGFCGCGHHGTGDDQ